MAKLVSVRCPDCGARLLVEAGSGRVVEHERAERGGRGRPERAPRVDLANAGDQLRAEESRRNRLFEESAAAERRRDEILDQKFDQALRRAREDPDSPPPPRDIDLD